MTYGSDEIPFSGEPLWRSLSQFAIVLYLIEYAVYQLEDAGSYNNCSKSVNIFWGMKSK
jgi:hypothetical protein